MTGLLTTVTAPFDRVSMHAVRRRLLQAQADRLRLPLHTVELPWPCPNQVYEAGWLRALETAAGEGVTTVVFGDLFLRDVRAYREALLAPFGIRPSFPLWDQDTRALARRMLRDGLRAIVTCVDPKALDPQVVGRPWDRQLLDDLPPGVDPCGERGEFHTFVTNSPDFASPVAARPGARLLRDGFWFADLLLD